MESRFYRTRPRLYALAAGVGLGLWATYDALLGRETGDAALHAVLGLGMVLWVLVAGARKRERETERRAAAAMAAVLLGVAALGIFSPTLFGYGRFLTLRFDLVESLAHAAIGAVGAYVAANE